MGKNNYHLKNIKEGTKVESYSIKKFKVGAASVVIGASIFFGAGAVAQASEAVSNNTVTDESLGTEKKLEVAPKAQAKPVVENTRESLSAALASKLENSEKETLNKVALTKLIEEIDGKFANGKYASKTEESVNQLKAVLEEARTALNNAKTQDELSQAQAKLVTATTKLQTKPEEKKEEPAVDTTNGKSTVGKTVANAEKSSDSNSIANSGSRDERNGKALNTNNPFRTDTTPSTTDDTSASRVFDNPAEGADVKTLSNKLESLPETIQNNEKIQNMDELGNAKNVAKGQVLEIDEFGGWNAVGADGKPGKFAIARKTDKGVFPIETVNTVWNSGRKIYQTWVLEQSFDRTSDYMLFLSKVRTKADKEEETFDGSKYVHTGEPGNIARGVKGFNGIQKTFKAYSKEHGSKVVVSFKTGYTGDIEGTKAQYKVEVIINRNGKEEKLYDQTFKPQEAQQNDEMTVVKASDGKNSPQFITTPDTPSPTKENLDAKIANNKPNGTGGTFTSKEIEIPKGVTEYTVRISSADNQHLGMGYQSVHRHYALPLTGSDFSIKQDTKNVAKDLLQRIYNRLVEQKSEDTKWSTPETKGAYETKLTEIDNLLNSGINTTSNYKESAKSLIEKYNSLNNRDTIIEAAKADLEKAAQAEKAEIAADKSLTEAERKEKENAVDTKKAEEEAKITEAENADKVAEAKTAGEAAVKAVHTPGNLDTVKEAAKADLEKAAQAEKAEIAADKSLTEAERKEKETAVDTKKAEEEAKIAAAENADKVAEAKTAGEKAIKGVHTPGNLDTVKEAAKAEIDAALAEKAKAIEANDKLSDAEKAAAKEEAKKAADEAKKAIEAATDQAGVDAKAAEGTKAVEAVNPVGKDKAKEEVEGELAKKLAELENSTDLTDAEKATAKTRVLDEAKKAIEAIEKAMTQAEVDQAIRNFVYRISAVVLEKEEYDLSKLFVNGSVIVKQGETLADKDILSKLNLPEGVEVVKVEKPETVALGKGTAKVTLKLADGTQVTITVPVEVVKGSTTSGITKLSSEGVKTGETEESSNKVSNKQLPNTGTTETNTGLAGLGLAMLTGLFAVARRRKEK